MVDPADPRLTPDSGVPVFAHRDCMYVSPPE
ncbi:MAG: hypothetical protein ACI8S6_004762 [Myxococcota bacterium]|jgi:hypothetical protein